MRPGRRRALAAKKKNCTCQHWVTGRLKINVVRDEEDETIVLDVTAPSGFPKRIGFSPHVVVNWQAQVPWMAEDGKDGTVIIRTTAPPAEHRYRQKGCCIPCGMKLMEYEGHDA